jgi:hypothetical protein
VRRPLADARGKRTGPALPVPLKAEFESFLRDDDAEIPAYPIMSASRHAVACLARARKDTAGKGTGNAPTLNIV